MSKKTEMSHREAIEIVLTAAKTLIDGHGELPINAKTPYRAELAIRIAEKSLANPDEESKPWDFRMTHREAIEIVLTAAKTLIDGHGELPVNAKTPYRASLAIRIVEKSLALDPS